MRTRTTTSTTTRLRLIEINARIALQALLSDEDDALVHRIVRGVREKLLDRLSFVALDSRGEGHAVLTLKVNWGMHEELSHEHGELTVDGKLVREGHPMLRDLLPEFREIAATFRVELRVRICPELDKAEVRDRLGLRPAAPWRWARPRHAATETALRNLEELAVGLQWVE